MFRRLGNKKNLMPKIEAHFPNPNSYSIWIEPFFGGGGAYFSLPYLEHKTAFVNDFDDDVYNLFMLINSGRDKELYAFVERMPIHKNLFDYWRNNAPTNDIEKAARFLLLSTFSFLGKSDYFVCKDMQGKGVILDSIQEAEKIVNRRKISFHCTDALRFLKAQTLLRAHPDKTFVYCDPPYLKTTNNYKDGFNADELVAIIDFMQSVDGLRFCISEYGGGDAEEIFKAKGLNVIDIGRAYALNFGESTDIIATNYKAAEVASLF